MTGDKANSAPAKAVPEGLHDAQVVYMKRIEKENFERVMKLKRIKKNNILTGLCLAGSVCGIYLYSILAVKQENFLDELDDQVKTQ